MRVRHLIRKKIDVSAWDERVAAQPLTPVYNYSWYLDAATNGRWNAIVGGDYEQLLPLPFNRKWLGLPQVYQPPMTQQLGVLSCSAEKIQQMLTAIPGYYLRLLLQIRLKAEQFTGLTMHQRSNLLMDLQPDYEELASQYSRSLRKRLRRAVTHYRLEPATDVAALIRLYRENVGARAGLSNSDFVRINSTIQTTLDRQMGQLQQVVATTGQIHAMGFFAGQHRISNLFGASTAAGRAGFAMHFLLDQIIRSHAGRPRVFDFEGSELPGVREFFLSFGAEEEVYGQWRRGI